MGVGAQSVTGLCGCGGSECDRFIWVYVGVGVHSLMVYVGVGAQSVTGLCGCGGSECDGFMWVWGLRV